MKKMQGCEYQKGPGSGWCAGELNERAMWVGHKLEGMSHSAKLTVCTVNKAFHSRSVSSLAGHAQEHTEKSEVHCQKCCLNSTNKELQLNTLQTA